MKIPFAPGLPRTQQLILFGVGVCCLLGFSLTIAAYMLLPLNPNGDELLLFVISWGSSAFILTMNFCLLALLGALIIASIVYNMGKGLEISYAIKQPTQSALPSITISPDVLIISKSEDYTNADLLVASEAAQANQRPGQWIVVIGFRSMVGLLYTGNKTLVFDRQTPPYQPDDTQNPISAHDYKAETWQEYQDYLNEFSFHFVRWAEPQKMIEQTGQPADMKIKALWSLCLSALFFVLPVSVSAQKSVRVSGYLGQFRFENVRPAGTVKFIFEKAVVSRNGNGQMCYSELLKANAAFSDSDNAGKLVGIHVVENGITSLIMPDPKEGKTQAPKAKTVTASMDAQSARPMPGQTELNDSLQTAATIDEMKRNFDRTSSKVWGQTLQWWDFGNYVCMQIFYILLCFLGLARYVAKTAVNETRISAWGTSFYGGYIHNVAAAATLITYLLIVCIALFLLLNIFISGVSGNYMNVLFLLFSWKFAGVCLWFGILRIFERITDWVVPNPKVQNDQPRQFHRGPDQYKSLNQ